MTNAQTNSHANGDLRLPPERFFWAVLDTSSAPRARGARRREQLGYMFESVVPVPLEQLHVEFTTLGPDRVLVCGARRLVLEGTDPDIVTLGPASLPDWISEEGADVDPHRINLLTGPFEPAPVRRARTRWVTQCAAVLVVAASVVWLGTHRRANAADAARREATRLVDAAYTEALGPSPAGGQPPAARLTAELRRLRQTREPGAAVADPIDAAPLLAGVLARWPEGVEAQTEQITVSSSSVRFVVRLADTASAERLTDALTGDGRWRTVGEQSVERTSEGVRVRVSLEPVEPPTS